MFKLNSCQIPRCAIILVFLLSSFFAKAQENSLTGEWEGVIYKTENDTNEGFLIRLFLLQKEDKITGRSFIKSGDLYVEFEIEGTYTQDGVFIFEDKKIISQTKEEDMSWCTKRVFLHLENTDEGREMKGRWTGSTEFTTCSPGSVKVKKKANRA